MSADVAFDNHRRSCSPAADRYGRDTHSREETRKKSKTLSRENRRPSDRDSHREHEEDRGRWRRDDEGGRRFGDRGREGHNERDEYDRERDRTQDRNSDGGRNRRTRSSERRPRRAGDEATARQEVQTGSKHSHSIDRRPSRWGNVVPTGNALNGASGFENHAFGAGDRSNGVYGPADTGRPSGGDRGWGGGGGGRGQGNGAPRDESWVEHRLKLRAEARAPRGVWNRSPSPPRKKEAKVLNVPSVNESRRNQSKGREQNGGSREARVVSSRKRHRKKFNTRKPHRKRSPSVASSTSSSSSSDSSSDSSSSSSSSRSSSGNGGSNSGGGSDGVTGDNSTDNRSDEQQKIARRASVKPKKRPSSPNKTEQDWPKAARPASPALLVPPTAEVVVKSVGDDIGCAGGPAEELDELDAAEVAQFKADVQGHRHHEESDEDAGPMPVPQLDELQGEGERGVNYGGALLPGEGAAIAQFVQKGLRIPRRGEVGWAGQEIERLEDSGYVMSGSRHARMNAVRLRKENQVFNAEERRALALIMFEEKQQKENEILGNFRQMLTESTREGDKPTGQA